MLLKRLREAVLEGASQIAAPTLVSTLTICIVFVSVVFLTGPAKYLFTPMALAVVFAMLASYLLSSTFVPVLSAWLLRHGDGREGGNPSLFDRSRDAYGRALSGIVRARWIVVTTGLTEKGRTEVTSVSLIEGHKAIVEGQVGLPEGSPVVIQP